MSRLAQFGPRLHSDAVTFRLWAPSVEHAELVIDRPLLMQRHADGWHEFRLAGVGPGTRYTFRLDGKLHVPDPASHFQPEDVSGPSEVIDHAAYHWKAPNWRGRPWAEVAFLECHVGTFTSGGDFRSMIERLDHVVECGITAIELMPIADFAGHWNWGYDGVFLYAPDNSYGRPDDLKALIDEAHLRGLMVFLDVVYNHFGPEGNYLGQYAPAFFTAAHTPWGSAIDYRVPEVRTFAIENALHWLEHYRFDGLRLDAVHAIIEHGSALLMELSRAVGVFASITGRFIHLVLENDDNASALLDPIADPPVGRYRAQWNDDYHHAWHVLLTGENGGYYGDYAGDAGRHITRILSSGFAYQGEPSAHRGGRKRGQPSKVLSPLAFVDFLQNHDQIGNRPLGDRLNAKADSELVAAALAIILIAPMPPLMFMGEEWDSHRPFPFFCDFQGDLAEAVRAGRRAEFKDAYARHSDEIPDPLSEETFRSAKLDWDARDTPAGQRRITLIRGLLSARRTHVVPRLANAQFEAAQFEDEMLHAYWLLDDGQRLILLANLSDQARPCPPVSKANDFIWGGAPPDRLPRYAVYWAIGDT